MPFAFSSLSIVISGSRAPAGMPYVVTIRREKRGVSHRGPLLSVRYRARVVLLQQQGCQSLGVLWPADVVALH